MRLCYHVRKNLSDARDGQLPFWHTLFIRFHATVCPPCRRVNRSLESVVSLLHELRDETNADKGTSA